MTLIDKAHLCPPLSQAHKKNKNTLMNEGTHCTSFLFHGLVFWGVLLHRIPPTFTVLTMCQVAQDERKEKHLTDVIRNKTTARTSSINEQASEKCTSKRFFGHLTCKWGPASPSSYSHPTSIPSSENPNKSSIRTVEFNQRFFFLPC